MWVVGVALLSSSPFFIFYWRSYWSGLARSLFVTAFLGGVFVLVYALQLGATDAVAASHIFRFEAPLMLLLSGATLYNTYGLLGRVPPKKVVYLGAVYVGWAVLSVLSGPLWDAVRQNADGYWVVPLHQTWAMAGMELGSLLTGLVAVFLYVRELLAPRRTRYVVYAVLSLLTIPLFWNDAVLADLQRTVYPTLWITVAFYGFIAWYELFSQVRQADRMLRTDTLTGAYTRGYGELVASREQGPTGTGVLFVDVDRFKDVNDTYGHTVGDEVLRGVAGRLKKGCRSEDVVIRMGGDEFALVLSGVDAKHVNWVLHRVEASFEQRPIVAADASQGAHRPVTVSIGSAWSAGQHALPELFDRADQRMYQVKQAKKEQGGFEYPGP